MTKLKTWFYEEIQGMCTLNSLMEFISWTKEGPEFITINNSEFSKPTPDGG